MITATARTDGTVDLVGYQGTTWELTVSVFSDAAATVPLNLAGYTAKGQYRRSYSVNSPVLIEFTCVVLPFDIITNPDTNIVTVTVLPAASSSITTFAGVYDVEITKGNSTERIIQGKLTINPEVTRV